MGGPPPAGGPEYARRGQRRRQRARRAAWHVAARLPQAPAGARGRRPDRAQQGGAGGELRARRRAARGRLGLDVALREVLDRKARLARPLSLSAGGIAGMEQATRQKPFLNLVRSYPVAPEKVWRAWTDATAVKKGWGAR